MRCFIYLAYATAVTVLEDCDPANEECNQQAIIGPTMGAINALIYSELEGFCETSHQAGWAANRPVIDYNSYLGKSNAEIEAEQQAAYAAYQAKYGTSMIGSSLAESESLAETEAGFARQIFMPDAGHTPWNKELDIMDKIKILGYPPQPPSPIEPQHTPVQYEGINPTGRHFHAEPTPPPTPEPTMFPTEDPEECDRWWFSDIDVNTDYIVSLEEFVGHCLYCRRPIFASTNGTNNFTQEDLCEGLFHIMDGDEGEDGRDHYLEASEYYWGLYTMKGRAKAQGGCFATNVEKGMDDNKDGITTYGEYKAFCETVCGFSRYNCERMYRERVIVEDYVDDFDGRTKSRLSKLNFQQPFYPGKLQRCENAEIGDMDFNADSKVDASELYSHCRDTCDNDAASCTEIVQIILSEWDFDLDNAISYAEAGGSPAYCSVDLSAAESLDLMETVEGREDVPRAAREFVDYCMAKCFGADMKCYRMYEEVKARFTSAFDSAQACDVSTFDQLNSREGDAESTGGTLEWFEIWAYYKYWCRFADPNSWADQFMETYDGNKDGHVTRNEFNQYRPPKINLNFLDYDQDRRGYIDTFEMFENLKPHLTAIVDAYMVGVFPPQKKIMVEDLVVFLWAELSTRKNTRIYALEWDKEVADPTVNLPCLSATIGGFTRIKRGLN